MKVLVTGASGFLGQYSLDALQRHGIPSVALGRTRPVGVAAADFVAADLLATSDFGPIVRAAGASHLLHLAWVTEHGRYWDSPLNYRWVDATTRLVQAFCESGGRHVVVAGTCAEYDWSAGRCREDETALDPSSAYGVAKDATRRLVMALCAGCDVSCSWARVFFPYGAGEAPQRLLPSLVDALRGRSAPFGVNAQVRRDFIHASDVASGLSTLLRCGAHGAYNLASGEATALADLVRMLAQVLDADPRPILALASERAAEPSLLVGENRKLQALGWRVELTLEQGLQRVLREQTGSGHGRTAGVHVA